MDFWNLVKVNIKRYLKNPVIVLMSFALPIITLGVTFSSGNTKTSQIAIINNDSGNLSIELIKEMDKEFKVKEYKGETNEYIQELKDSKIGAIYVISPDFSNKIINLEVPKVEEYVVEESSGAILAENIIDNYIKGYINENSNTIEIIVKDNDGEERDKFIVTMLMISYLMIIGSSIISEDIIKLRLQKVLKRTLSTANSDRAILGSILIAGFLIQSILTLLAFFVVTIVLDIKVFSAINVAIVIILSSLLSTALVIFTSRWIKNPQLSSLVGVIYGLFSIVLAMMKFNLIGFENIPKKLMSLNTLSPLSWVVDILEGKNIILASIVIVLMSLVFFTAGSFRIRDFVKE